MTFPFSLSKIIRRIPPRRELFFVLKFGNKVYLKMTETQLRAEIAATNGVGVQFRDKSLVFQAYEIDTLKNEEQPKE